MRTWMARRCVKWAWALVVTWLMAGCAHVAFDHGATRLDDKALVFGRILLDRDGESVVVSPMSMPLVIRDISTSDEPRMITQSFEPDGRFFWTLPPGRYQLSLVLHRYSGGLVSYSFNVPRAGTAYHWGDLTLHGRKRFDTLGGANIRDVRAEFKDSFEADRTQLLQRNPQLAGTRVEALVLRDMTDPAQRVRAYGDVLAQSAPCCASLDRLPFQPLMPGQSVESVIGPSSPVFDFPEGRSRFVAWALPDAPALALLRLRSPVTPSLLAGADLLYVFSPAVLWLDEHHQIIARAERGLFGAVPASMMPPRAASLQADVPLEVQGRRARYLVLYTTPALLGADWSSYRPGFVAVPGGALPTGMPVGLTLEPSISGVIEVDSPGP